LAAIPGVWLLLKGPRNQVSGLVSTTLIALLALEKVRVDLKREGMV